MRVELQDIYNSCETREDAEPRMNKLCSWMMHSRLPEMKKFCGTLKIRNKEYFKTMIYLVCRDLDYDAVIKTYSEVKKITK